MFSSLCKTIKRATVKKATLTTTVHRPYDHRVRDSYTENQTFILKAQQGNRLGVAQLRLTHSHESSWNNRKTPRCACREQVSHGLLQSSRYIIPFEMPSKQRWLVKSWLIRNHESSGHCCVPLALKKKKKKSQGKTKSLTP